MSILLPSPLLPWDVIAHIIEANWIEPVDITVRETLTLFVPRSNRFGARAVAMMERRKEIFPWMTVSKETNRIASRLYYHCIALTSQESLVKFTNLVQNPSSSQPIAPLIRYLSVNRLSEDHEVMEEEEALAWWKEMHILTSLLPNLAVLRGGLPPTNHSEEVQDEMMAALLSCPSKSLSAISSMGITTRNQADMLSLIQQSSSSLQLLRISGIDLNDADPSGLLPSSLTAFPLLHSVVYNDFAHMGPIVLPLSSSDWILPALRTLQIDASPFILPIIQTHDPNLRELGFEDQSFDDEATYESWFGLCPSLETFAWEVWEPLDEWDDRPVAFNFVSPVTSVRTITISNRSEYEEAPTPSLVDGIVPLTVNRTNFPSLERVVFGSHVEISRTLLDWGESLVKQGVVVEWIRSV